MNDPITKRMTELFNPETFLCAESVVKVIAEAGGKNADDAVRMATGFCSGAARTCGQCGAVSGAIMGIGLYAGRAEPGADYDAAYALVQDFIARFQTEFDSLNCFDLIECDFKTDEGQQRYKKKNLREHCLLIAITAAKIALSLLREHGYLPNATDFIKSRLAPCGLSCGKCLAFADGPIQQHAKNLQEELGDNFGAYAQRFEGMNPTFKHYEKFRELLDYLATGSCSGCRGQGCLFQACTIPACIKSKNVDYCFECDEFPCDHHGMPDGLAQRWQANNEKMREIGVEAWFVKTIDKPRYP